MEIRPFSDASYKQFLRGGLLMASQCKSCGTLAFPPRQICASCRGTEGEWVDLSRTGRLAAFTSIFIAPPAMVAQGFDRNKPYVVGVVDLDEGVRAVARVLGVDAKNPDTIKIGSPVKTQFPEASELADWDCPIIAPQTE